MKHFLRIMAIFTLLIGGAACATPQTPASENSMPTAPLETATAQLPAPTDTPASPTSTPETPELQDSAFSIDGMPIQLVNGISEVEAAPGSATKIVTRYFGNAVLGDLNGDGKEDAVFLVTQEPGGSGTFFYVVAALRTEDGYQGTNAVLLGDRISPQPITIVDGTITVNYADRKPGEPFDVPPSVGVTKTFTVDGSTLSEAVASGQITNRTWTWVRTQMNDGTVIEPRNPEEFTITLAENGQVTGTTDCNDFSGQYTTGEGGLLSFEPFISTMMLCDNSQETDFVSRLQEVQSYMFDNNGQLILLIKMDSGSIILR